MRATFVGVTADFARADWLASLEVPTFGAAHFQRQPYARPQSALDAVALLDWSTLDAVLSSPAPLDVLTVARGRLVEAPMPRSSRQVRQLLRDGVSTVVRGSEVHHPPLASLAARFTALFGGEVHVQLYATPAGTHSYGWHYDFEDVFIAQTAGVKDYYFRDNTVARTTRLGDELDFTAVQRERSQLLGAQLVAGDALYIPSRWWHLVKCVEESLSISVGVMPDAELRQARRIPQGWGRR